MKDQKGFLPKVEVLDFNLPYEDTYSRHTGGNVASSSGSNLRSSFIGMGFAPDLVDRVVGEKGEEDVDLLLETLFAYSAHKKSCSHSSDSLDSLFDDDKDTCSQANIATKVYPKEEVDVLDGVDDNKRMSLLGMNFSVDEVDFAIHKLGNGAPIDELVDFIFASRIAETFDKDIADPSHNGRERNEESNTEAMFTTMDKTLRLLEMGFSEHEVSMAIEKYGSEITIAELADAIAAYQAGEIWIKPEKYSNTSFSPSCASLPNHSGTNLPPLGGVRIKTEDCLPESVSQFRVTDNMEKYKGKRPKEEYFDEPDGFKWPKEEYGCDLASFPGLASLDPREGDLMFDRMSVPRSNHQSKARRGEGSGSFRISKPYSCDSVDRMVAKPPYFLFGDVTNLCHESWVKISQFLYAIEPEFVDTRHFSALSRREGYVHNLPAQNRSHILPSSPQTIEEAVPHTKKWWPSWDTRKQFSCISSETSGISQLCGSLEKILVKSKGMLSDEQQRYLLHQCQSLNLVWVGQNKLAPTEPEHLEVILGYPLHHTRISGCSTAERLEMLKGCFQVDALGYHISALKSLFPGGLTVLSIYSGMGGAEITLHRLGIRLKAVVSIERSETKRRILKLWWQNSGQSGELVQIEDVQKISSNKLDDLIKKYGGFDFIFCQNPNSSKCSNMAADRGGLSSFDFTMFYEFVRIVQRVRSRIGRNK